MLLSSVFALFSTSFVAVLPGRALRAPVRFGSVRSGPVRSGSVWFGSLRSGSFRVGSVPVGSCLVRRGPGLAPSGLVRFGSARLGSVRFVLRPVKRTVVVRHRVVEGTLEGARGVRRPPPSGSGRGWTLGSRSTIAQGWSRPLNPGSFCPVSLHAMVPAKPPCRGNLPNESFARIQ